MKLRYAHFHNAIALLRRRLTRHCDHQKDAKERISPHYLWGMRNTWATHQYALVFLINYDGDNGPICRLKMRIMMMHVYIVHRNARFIGGADYGSREAGDMWFDPLIS